MGRHVPPGHLSTYGPVVELLLFKTEDAHILKGEGQSCVDFDVVHFSRLDLMRIISVQVKTGEKEKKIKC